MQRIMERANNTRLAMIENNSNGLFGMTSEILQAFHSPSKSQTLASSIQLDDYPVFQKKENVKVAQGHYDKLLAGFGEQRTVSDVTQPKRNTVGLPDNLNTKIEADIIENQALDDSAIVQRVSMGHSVADSALSGNVCIQFIFNPSQLNKIKRDAGYQAILANPAAHTDSGDNLMHIREIIERVFPGQSRTSPENIRQIANSLGIPIPEEAPSPALPSVDRTKFSAGADLCDDTTLSKILDDIHQSPFISKKRGLCPAQTYYHIDGGFNSSIGKPIWQIDTIDADEKVRICGMYTHGKNNKVYHKILGEGPDTIEIA